MVRGRRLGLGFRDGGWEGCCERGGGGGDGWVGGGEYTVAGETCLGVLAAGDRSQDVLVEHFAVVLDEQLVVVIVDCIHTRHGARVRVC